MTDILTAARPDQEFYQRVIEELGQARQEQAVLRILKVYDTTEVPGSTSGSKKPETVYDFIYNKGNRQGARPPRGKQLDDAIVAAQLRREQLEVLLEAYNAAEQAWVDAQPQPDVPSIEIPANA